MIQLGRTAFVLLITMTTAWPLESANEAVALVKRLDLRESASPISDHPRWRENPRILITLPRQFVAMFPDVEQRFRAAAEPAEVTFFRQSGSPFPSAELLAEADAFLGTCHGNVLRDGAHLVWLQSYFVGVERCVSAPNAAELDVVLTNVQRLSAPTIAEHAIAMIMMLNRNLHLFHQAKLQSRWDQSIVARSAMSDLGGKTVLVVGLGGIGTEIARRANALGMRVIATRNSSRTGPAFVDYVGLADELLDLTAQADVIANALPLTTATRGIFDAEFFAATRKGALFVSVGRGASTVTSDLVSALKSGQLGGAGLDVTDPEPLPQDHELWRLDNVIITPHVAGFSPNNVHRIALMVEENLRRFVAGDKLLNVVDWQRRTSLGTTHYGQERDSLPSL